MLGSNLPYPTCTTAAAWYMDYCTHTYANSPFCRSIAPPKSLVLPQIPPQAGQRAEQHIRPTNIESSSFLSLWSPPPAHNDPYILSPPATDRYLTADPSTDAVTHSSAGLTSPSSTAIREHPESRPVWSPPHPPASTAAQALARRRRWTSIDYLARGQPRTRTRTRLRTSTRQGQGAASHYNNTSSEARHRQARNHL